MSLEDVSWSHVGDVGVVNDGTRVKGKRKDQHTIKKPFVGYIQRTMNRKKRRAMSWAVQQGGRRRWVDSTAKDNSGERDMRESEVDEQRR